MKEQALGIFARSQKPEHPSKITVLNELAALYQTRGDTEKTQDLEAQAVNLTAKLEAAALEENTEPPVL